LGDGGAVVTSNEEVAKEVRALRDYGQVKKYHHVLPAYNKRLDTIQASVLRVKLRYLDRWNDARRRTADLYDERIVVDRLKKPHCLDECYHVYHQYVVQHDERDKLRSHLTEAGIGTGLHYPVPIHLQPCYKHLGHREGDFPAAEKAARGVLSLPIFPGMEEEETEYVVAALESFSLGNEEAA
jgi:dTDP-4-amino-4,6-dideoxygalactose transaminase